MSQNPQDKIAHQRLSMLELAEALGNVSSACRQRVMIRTQFYDYKRRFEFQGLEGLKDLSPTHKSHPQTTRSEALNDLAHTQAKVRHPQTTGFVERFHRTIKEEFFEAALRETFYESMEMLRNDLDRWLIYYNTERPHLGYRNMDKRTIDTVNA